MENIFRNLFPTDKVKDILKLANSELKTVDGFIFPVNKELLANASYYFRRLFCQHGAESRQEFFIPCISGEILGEILRHLYKGKYSCTENNIAALMIGADYLCAIDILNEIQDNHKDKINVSNCVILLLCSHQISNQVIHKNALRFIQLHFDEIVRNDKTVFAEITLDLLSTFLCSRSLHVLDEIPVWLAVVGWVQKDLQNRLSCVPFLLKHLARKDVDESLATEIMNHTIVGNNPHCKISNNNKFRTNLQAFLAMTTDSLIDNRIPSKLYIVAKAVEYADRRTYYGCYIYATFDKQLDLWRKISELEYYPCKILPAQNILYVFSWTCHCSILDLKQNSLRHVNHLFQESSHFVDAVDHDGLIYVFVSKGGEPSVRVFHPEGNLWKIGTPNSDISYFKAASISRDIYIVGKLIGSDTVSAQVYDKKSDRWSVLSPSKFSFQNLRLELCHGKFFAMGGVARNRKTVDIFDPKTENWRQAVDLPVRSGFNQSIVYNDKLYAYWTVCEKDGKFDQEWKRDIFAWNEAGEIWEESNDNVPLLDQDFYTFCEVHDPSAIRTLSKGFQNRKMELEMTCLDCSFVT